MTRILLLSEQHMIYPSIFSNYYRPKGYLLSINVKIFARMGFFNKNVFRLCSYSKFYGNQDNRKIPSVTSSQLFLLFPILGYKRGEQNSPFSRQGNCLKFISGPPVLLQTCRSREGGMAPKVLTDQLTLSQPGGKEYPHYYCPPTRIFRPSYGSVLSHISNVWSAPLTCFRYDSFNKEQRRTVAASVSGQSSEFLVGRKKRRQMDCEK